MWNFWNFDVPMKGAMSEPNHERTLLWMNICICIFIKYLYIYIYIYTRWKLIWIMQNFEVEMDGGMP